MLLLQQQHEQPGTAPARWVHPQTLPTSLQVHFSHLISMIQPRKTRAGLICRVWKRRENKNTPASMGIVCLCASWTCLQATCAKQTESASILFSTPFEAPSPLENLPSSEFDFASMNNNVIKESTRKGLTDLSTTDSPYPGWQAYELCSATFILDIWTFLVYTHPFSCHSARILWIPLAHNSRSRLLN